MNGRLTPSYLIDFRRLAQVEVDMTEDFREIRKGLTILGDAHHAKKQARRAAEAGHEHDYHFYMTKHHEKMHAHLLKRQAAHRSVYRRYLFDVEADHHQGQATHHRRQLPSVDYKPSSEYPRKP